MKAEGGRGVAIGTALRTPARGAPKRYKRKARETRDAPRARTRTTLPEASVPGQWCLYSFASSRATPQNPTFRHVGPGPAYSLAINACGRESSSLARTGWRRGRGRSRSRQGVNESGAGSCSTLASRAPLHCFGRFDKRGLVYLELLAVVRVERTWTSLRQGLRIFKLLCNHVRRGQKT